MTHVRIIRGTRDTEAFLDERLSYRARGALAFIMHDQSGETPGGQRMSERGREGREAMATALRELESFGYITRRTDRDERGKFVYSLEVRFTPDTSDTQ